jgi:Spy/CpxP family protein refolding chaperone
MKSSIKSLMVVMAITGAVGAGLAYAFPPGGAQSCPRDGQPLRFGGHGGVGDSDRLVERLAARLDLSKAQRDALYAILDQARPQERVLREQLLEAHQQLRALRQQDAPQEVEVRKLADAQAKAIADLIVLRTKVQLQIRGVLTQAQRRQLQQWRAQHLRPAGT